MSADRSKVHELALTPLDIMKARGATKKEIDEYIRKKDAYFLRRKNK